MTNTIPKRGDVFFCQGSPDAIGSEERKTRPVVIIQNDAGNASSPTVIVANMTTNTSRRLYPMQFDIDLPGHSPSRVQCEQIRTVDKCRLRERIYTLTGEELRKLDDCLAVSFGMTRQAAQEAAHSAPEAQDDIFHELTRNGLSVAVCPLPVLNQVNITITDGKTVSMTRNVAPAGGIVSELLDMKDTLKEVTPWAEAKKPRRSGPKPWTYPKTRPFPVWWRSLAFAITGNHLSANWQTGPGRSRPGNH